jgi:hypothetical protein
VYYSDLEDIEEIGWDRFVCDAWEAIFVAYRSTAGIMPSDRDRLAAAHRELRAFLRENFLS